MTEGARVISHTLHVSGHTVDALLEASEHRLSCWPGRTLSHAQSRSTPWASRKDPGSSSLQLSSHALHVSGHTCLASVPTSQSNGTRCGRASNQMHGSRESKKGTSNVPVGSSSQNPSLVGSLEGIDEDGCDDGGGGKDGLMESDGLDKEGWDDGGAGKDGLLESGRLEGVDKEGWDDAGEGKDGLLESDGTAEVRLRSQALHVSRQTVMTEDPGTQSRSC